MLNPTIRYNRMNRADTVKMMQDEAKFYDLIFASDATEAEFDILVPAPGGGTQLLKVPVVRGIQRVRPQEKGDDTPTQGEPNRTVDLYGAPRSILTLVPDLDKMGGRTMKFENLTYTISYAKPRVVAGVVYFVELHVDPNEGMFLPAGKGGLL